MADPPATHFDRRRDIMKLHHSFGAAALSLVVTGCGLGDGADIGESANQPIGATGGSENGGAAGATESAGGAKQSSGGTEQSAGGATQASGGRSQGSGGAKQSTGGASQGAGGAIQGTGGGKPATGGSTGT